MWHFIYRWIIHKLCSIHTHLSTFLEKFWILFFFTLIWLFSNRFCMRHISPTKKNNTTTNNNHHRLHRHRHNISNSTASVCIHVYMNHSRWPFVLRDWKSISINNKCCAIQRTVETCVQPWLFFYHHTLRQAIKVTMCPCTSLKVIHSVLMNNCLNNKNPFLPTQNVEMAEKLAI